MIIINSLAFVVFMSSFNSAEFRVFFLNWKIIVWKAVIYFGTKSISVYVLDQNFKVWSKSSDTGEAGVIRPTVNSMLFSASLLKKYKNKYILKYLQCQINLK